MQLTFVRHGEYDDETADGPLTPHGVEMAEAAGAWLAENGLRPTQVITTPKRRARETGSWILSVFGQGPDAMVRSGHVRTPGDWEDLASLVGDGALFVGHHPTEAFLARAYGAPPLPEGNRCGIYVMKREGETWSCAAHWPGLPKDKH